MVQKQVQAVQTKHVFSEELKLENRLLPALTRNFVDQLGLDAILVDVNPQVQPSESEKALTEARTEKNLFGSSTVRFWSLTASSIVIIVCTRRRSGGTNDYFVQCSNRHFQKPPLITGHVRWSAFFVSCLR